MFQGRSPMSAASVARPSARAPTSTNTKPSTAASTRTWPSSAPPARTAPLTLTLSLTPPSPSPRTRLRSRLPHHNPHRNNRSSIAARTRHIPPPPRPHPAIRASPVRGFSTMAGAPSCRTQGWEASCSPWPCPCRCPWVAAGRSSTTPSTQRSD